MEPVQSRGGFQVVKTIEFANWRDWETATASEAIRAFGRDFERLVEPSSLMVLRGERITPRA